MDVTADSVAEPPNGTVCAEALPPPAEEPVTLESLQSAAQEAHNAQTALPAIPVNDRFDLDSEVAAPLCPRCLSDLSRLKVMARFCPRCGEQLMAGFGPVTPQELAAELKDAVPRARLPMFAPQAWPPTGWAPPVPATPILPPQPPPPPRTPAQLAVEVQRLAAEWLRLAERAANAAGDDVTAHSLMLKAYSNAMYRLGWRYESAAGGNRNADEAIRCYFKAARLGNSEALARLSPKCVAEPAEQRTPT